MIPETVLDEILTRCDIVEVISSYIPLKKAGRNFKALCPFHHEKTPSFVVNPDKGIYHCFGCGAGGNAFGFIMKYEKVEFVEAVRMLAKKAGVTIPDSRGNGKLRSDITTELRRLHEHATAFFRNSLMSRQGEQARAYLAKRGIGNQSIGTFKLGFAPRGWENLFGYLKEKGFSEELIAKSGLCLPREGRDGFYDRFRSRVIYPISDKRGRVVAFGGRVIDDSLPKYMNSPETAIYSKSAILYAFDLARDQLAEKDSAVIVEGYMDVIVAFQAGVRNIMASCGTALTTEQVRLIKRFTNNVILIYDADKAGQSATVRGLEALLAEDMRIGIVELPEGHDPDSYVRERDGGDLDRLIAKPTGIFEYRLRSLKRQYDPSDPHSKVKIAGEMLAMISMFGNEMLKSEYTRRLADSLKLSESSLITELAKSKAFKGSYSRPETSLGRPNSDRACTAEKIILSLMLEDSALIARVRKTLSCQEFSNNTTRKIAEAIFIRHEKGAPVSFNFIMTHLKDEGVDSAIAEIGSMQYVSKDKMKNLTDCLLWIKRNNLDKRKAELQGLIKEAQSRREDSKLSELLATYNKLVKDSASLNQNCMGLQ